MSRLKRIISKIMAICLCTSYINVLPTAAADNEGYSLQNSGFENPSISKTYDQPIDSNVPNWSTTAYGKKIEILKENSGTYIPGYKLTPREGLQAAELNADEQSSLYQNIQTTPGSFVKWGISHHGRNGYDTMLLVIGPKQSVNPAKKAKDGYDQFMKMGQYVKNNSELSDLIPTGAGASQEFVVYSPKFAAGGEFVTGENANFTTYRTVSNTEKWHIWFIRSNKDKWYDYGTNVTADTSALGYNNIYEVPESQTETTFAFTAYESAPKSDGKVDLTYGNIIDDISFGLLYNVSVHTLAGGSAAVTGDNKNDLSVSYTGKNFATDKYKSDSVVTLTVTPDDANDYIFTGAVINGRLYNYTDFEADSTNTVYTKDITVDEAKYIKLAFARKGHILYDPNGGKFKGTSAVTDEEYSHFKSGINETEVPQHSSAAFTQWTLYTNDGQHSGIKIPANHTVKYIAEDGVTPKLDISWYENGVQQSVTLRAAQEDGVLLVANYDFSHEAIALTDGGSVGIKNTTNTSTAVSGDDKHKKTAGEEGDIITVTANVAEGYQFDGWFEEETGEAVSKALVYSYAVTENSKIYAKFSVKVEEEVKEDVEPTPTPMPTAAPTEAPEQVPPYTIPQFDNHFAYIYGYDNTTMAPENNVLRGEVAAMLHRLVKQNKKLGGFEYKKSNPAEFDDIDGQWYRSAIEYMVHTKAMDKSERYSFAEREITRGETFRMVCLGLGYTKDHKLTNEQYGLILKDAHVIEGYDDGSLGLKDNITRAQFCKMYNIIIGRSNSLLETASGEKITAETYGFKDLEPGTWYYDTVLRATSAYDDDGYVDIAKRAVRNNLDDYDG